MGLHHHEATLPRLDVHSRWLARRLLRVVTHLHEAEAPTSGTQWPASADRNVVQVVWDQMILPEGARAGVGGRPYPQGTTLRQAPSQPDAGIPHQGDVFGGSTGTITILPLGEKVVGILLLTELGVGLRQMDVGIAHHIGG